MNTKEKIRQYFNKAKTSYDQNCQLQMTIGQQLISLIKQNNIPINSIIDIGCGTGIVTKQLAEEIYYREFHAIDIADQLLFIAKKRLQAFHIDAYELDMDHLFKIDRTFDVVFSNMSLHWSQHVLSTFNIISNIINKNGLFVFSIPLQGTFPELRNHFAIHPFVDGMIIEKQLSQIGYDVLTSKIEKIVLSFPNTITALKSIKNVGANYVAKNRIQGLRGSSFLNDITINEVTYIIGYFVAKK